MVNSPEAVLALIRGIDVEHNVAFQPRDGLTFCNAYTNVVTSALGCPVPNRLANDQHDWLLSEPGQLAGWGRIDSATASLRSSLGYPVVAAWRNPGGHGHIAPVVPAPAADPARLYVSAAGAENFVRCPLERSFGVHTPDLFTNRMGDTNV